jgi:hypothetical protein
MAYNFYTSSLQSLKAVITKSFSSGTNGHNHDGSNSRLVVTEQTKSITVETLAAGVDIADRVLAIVPTGRIYTLTDVKIISQGSAVGIDGSNTCAVVLKSGSDAIFTETYDNVNTFPAAGSATTIATLHSTRKILAAAANLKLSVTNGTTANPPQFMLQLTYSVTHA